MLCPLLFQPVYKESIWGGNALSRFGKKLPQDDFIGESWEISTLEPYLPTVAQGPYCGCTLPQLLQTHGPDLLGRKLPSSDFPLLVKFLDAKRSLSLQVHPAAPQGKAESWYILSAHPGAQVACGLKEGVTAATLSQRLAQGQAEDCFRYFPARPGDLFFIPPGIPHSLGAGIVAVEVEQNADCTYRLFDYNRKDAAGRLRPLQVAKALNTIHFAAQSNQYGRAKIKEREQQKGYSRILYDMQNYFDLQLLQINDTFTDQPKEPCFTIYVIAAGHAVLAWDEGNFAVSTGDVILVPASLPAIRLHARSLSFNVLRLQPVW